MTRLLADGSSWSGHERNNCYLGLGEGRYVDASFVSGLDFADDGRALAVMDHDGDGRLDLLFKNRTGPQLRLMHNRTRGSHHWLSLLLEGRDANRDAVGAEVRVRAGERAIRRFVAAGDGYLSQSSRRLHFGLGDAASIESVEVTWPGGSVEHFEGIDPDRGYRLVQGTGRAEPFGKRTVRYAAAEPIPAAAPGPTAVLLKTPLPLPPTITNLLPERGAPRAWLIDVWAEWCEPCRDELVGLAEAHAELEGAGLDVLALGVDVPEEADAARRFFETQVSARLGETAASFEAIPADAEVRAAIEEILRHVLVRHGELTLPTSLLVDPRGRLQMIYLGATTPATLLDHHRRFVTTPTQGARRSLYGGRWYYRSSRDLAGLAAALRHRGLDADARFYLALERLGRSQGN